MKKVLKMRAGWMLSGLTAAAMLASCSQENVEPAQNTDAPGTIRITLTLPGGGDVVYNPTRAIHSEEEWAINDLMVLDMKQNADNEWVIFNGFTVNNLTPIGNGEYSLAFSEPSEEIGEQHKFVFMANTYHGQSVGSGDLSHFKDVKESDFYNLTTWEAMENGTINASKFTQNGIVMSGTATDAKGSAQTVLTVGDGTVNCHVDMTRIVGRVDLYSNAPNLVITGATMRNAANTGNPIPVDYTGEVLFPADFNHELTIAYNDNYPDALAQGNPQAYTPETFAEKQTEQAYPDNGVRKAFYMYERENVEGDCLEVEVEYMLRDGSKGTVTVPFMKEDKTTGEKSYVDAERNHLYKIVLGNGEEVENGSDVTAEIIDEPWNVIDLPAVIPGVDSDAIVTERPSQKFSGLKDYVYNFSETVNMTEWYNEHKDDPKLGEPTTGLIKVSIDPNSDFYSLDAKPDGTGAISQYNILYTIFKKYEYYNNSRTDGTVHCIDLSGITKLQELSATYDGKAIRYVLPNSVKKITDNLNRTTYDNGTYISNINIPYEIESIDHLYPFTKERDVWGSTDYQLVLDLRGCKKSPTIELRPPLDDIHDQDEFAPTYICVKDDGVNPMPWQEEYTYSDIYKGFYVKDSLVDTYKNDAQWSAVRDIIFPESEFEAKVQSLSNPNIMKVWNNPQDFYNSPMWYPSDNFRP